ncbi:uncharacterized protein LOC144692749 [Cetorhinus maximus]
MPVHISFRRPCNIDSQSSSSYKSCPIYAPHDLPQYRIGRKRFSNVNSHSNQNQEQTDLEAQHMNYNAEQTDKVTKAAVWGSIQIKGKGIMSAFNGQDSYPAQIGKSSSLLLQCEENKKIPFDIDIMNEIKKAHSEMQDDCNPELLPAAIADSTEMFEASDNWNKLAYNEEGHSRPDSASSYQEKCIEAWRNISAEISGHREAVVKSANDSPKKLHMKDQLKRETRKTLSIISLDGGFTGSSTLESKKSLRYKSNLSYAPQNLQRHREGRKRISTDHSLSKQTEIMHRRAKDLSLSEKSCFDLPQSRSSFS